MHTPEEVFLIPLQAQDLKIVHQNVFTFLDKLE